MAPSFSRFYSTDTALQNSIFLCNNTVKAFIGADRFNLKFCKLRISMFFTACVGSMGNFIVDISLMRIPSKVKQIVVLAISIAMAALKTFWLGANKGCQNQRVNPEHFRLIIPPKQHEWAWIFFGCTTKFQRASNNVFNTALIGDRVKALKTNNRQPFFHRRHIGIWNIPLSNMAPI